MRKLKWLGPTVSVLFLMLPNFCLLNLSFKTTNEILGSFSLWPNEFTFDHYIKKFTDPTW